MTKKIAIFASGSGSNAENIIQYFSDHKRLIFPLIVSSSPNAFVHERAKKLNVPSYTFDKDEFTDGVRVLDLLKTQQIDGIVLAGFLLKIPEILLNAYPQKIINIHPALLPKFGGKGMYGHRVHEAVIASGEKKTGITIHYVNAAYDEGGTIFQVQCDVSSEDTPLSIAEKVHLLEYKYFPEIIEQIFV